MSSLVDIDWVLKNKIDWEPITKDDRDMICEKFFNINKDKPSFILLDFQRYLLICLTNIMYIIFCNTELPIMMFNFNLLYNYRLLEAIEKDYNYYHFNKRNSECIDIRDVIEIYRYVMKNSLSVACAEDLIESFFRRTAFNHIGKEIPISTFDTIKTNLEKDLSKLMPLKNLYYDLPKIFFGSKNGNKSVTRAEGVIFEIENVICQLFLEINPSELITTITEEDFNRQLKGLDVIYTNFVSGDLFNRYCTAVQIEHGIDAGVICYAIYHDNTTVDSGMRKQACPLRLMILNLINDSSNKYHLIGYIPINFKISDERLQKEFLSKHLSDAVKKEIMQFTYRQMTQFFVYESLKPLLKYVSSGIAILVGSGIYQITKRLFFFCSSIIADEPAKNLLSGPNYKQKYNKCSACEWYDASDFGLNNSSIVYRNDDYYNNKAIELQNIWTESILIKTKQMVQATSNEKKRRKIVSDKSKIENISPGDNKLLRMFKWARDHNVTKGMFQSLQCDWIHVYMEGIMIEGLLTNVLNIMQRCSIIDNKFRGVIAKLDSALMVFQFWQTADLCKQVPWLNGVSIFIKGFKTTKKLSLQTLGIESWKLLSLFVQIYFIIGSSGEYLPNNTKWFENNIPRVNPDKANYNFDISKQILAAMGSVIELTLLINSPSIKNSQLVTMDLLQKNCRVQIELVNMIRCTLFNVVFIRSNTVKGHLINHFYVQIPEMGI